MIKSVVLLGFSMFSFSSFAKSHQCWIRQSFDNENGNIVRQVRPLYLFDKQYFPLYVYIDLDDVRLTFRDSLLQAILIWNDAYDYYLNKNAEQLKWKGINIYKTGLNNYKKFIPGWDSGELFMFMPYMDKDPEVIIIETRIGKNKTLGDHISHLESRFFGGRDLEYSFIRIDQIKIKGINGNNNYLINVIMHELGHALGITHFNQTDMLMKAKVGGCGNGICDISDAVFEEFLRPYLSEGVSKEFLHYPARWNKYIHRKEAEAEANSRRWTHCVPHYGRHCP